MVHKRKGGIRRKEIKSSVLNKLNSKYLWDNQVTVSSRKIVHVTQKRHETGTLKRHTTGLLDLEASKGQEVLFLVAH